MNDNAPETYATIAEAEIVITAAGYQRDSQRHVWIDAAGKTARVLRTTDNPPKFFIKWG